MVIKEMSRTIPAYDIENKNEALKKTFLPRRNEAQRRVLQRVETDYPSIGRAEIFSAIPAPTGEIILNVIDDLRQSENGCALIKLTEDIFGSLDSFEITTNSIVNNYNLVIDDDEEDITPEYLLQIAIEEIASNDGIASLLPYMHDRILKISNSQNEDYKLLQAKNRLAMAIILSKLPAWQLSDGFSNQIGPMSFVDYKLKPTHESWYLCDDAEKKMNKDMFYESGLILIDDVMLTKNSGHVTGLCIKPAATNQGILVPGMWYSPTSKDFRDQVRGAISRKEPCLNTGYNNTEWAIMRSVSLEEDPNQSPAQFINKAAEYGKHLRQTLGHN